MSLKEYSLSFVTDFLGQEVEFLRENDFVEAAGLVGQMSSFVSRKNFGKEILKKNIEGCEPVRYDNSSSSKPELFKSVGGLVALMSRRQ